MNVGTIDNPVLFRNALRSTKIIPGDTLLLRDGVYEGDVTCRFSGLPNFPISIQAYPGEHPVIDGPVIIEGNYTRWIGLEIRYSGWESRQSNQAGSYPSDLPMRDLFLSGIGNKVINCYIHDLAGVGLKNNNEMYGNVISNIGWLGPDRGHGHSAYAQNGMTERLVIRNNIMLNSFGYGVHAYAEGGSIGNYDIEKNTLFNAGHVISRPSGNLLMGGYVVPNDPHIIGNMTYGGYYGIQIGYGNRGATHVTCKDNYSPDGLIESGTIQYDEKFNNYSDVSIGNQTFVHTNDYDANRANVTIFNENSADVIAVDVEGIFEDGTTVSAYNVQDYSDVQILTVVAGKILLSMTGRTVSSPICWNAPTTTFPQFGCFVIVRTN